jgi:hypothetical protein
MPLNLQIINTILILKIKRETVFLDYHTEEVSFMAKKVYTRRNNSDVQDDEKETPCRNCEWRNR